MNLYDIRQDIQESLDKYYACFNEDGELIVTEEEYKEIEKLLFESQNQKDELLTWYLQDRANKLASMPGIDQEIERLSKKKESLQKKVDRIEKTLDFHFQEMYKGKPLAFGNFTIAYRKSEAVKIDNEESIPKQFIKEKLTTSIDKVAIKKEISSGKEVKGASIEIRNNLQIN